MKTSTLAAALLAVTLTFSCSKESAHDHDHDHDHDAEQAHAPKSDPHHVNESRTDCEDDVVLERDALEMHGIKTAPVQSTELAPSIPAPGRLVFPPSNVARVGSPVFGRVVEVRIRPGDSVVRGDPLLVIESPQLGEAQSDYLKAAMIADSSGPAVEIARKSYERAKELRESVEGVSLTEVERREAEYRALERDQKIAKAAELAAFNKLLLLGLTEASVRELEKSEKVDSRFTIAAPLEGRVIELAVAQGELVDPTKERLLVIGDPRTLWVVAEVSESRLREVSVGAPARISVPALAGLTLDVTVSAIAPLVESATRTAEVRMEVPNESGRLSPGMFVGVDIESSARHAGLALPDAAVMEVEGRTCVFVPLEPGSSTFCLHAVTVGPPVREWIPVKSGLKEGDLVVVSGAFLLKAELGKSSATHEH